jgi:hypothetical protein
VYSTVGFRIRIIDPVANHATTASINPNIETYFVACNRTNDVTLDTPDSCYVRGPSTKVRAVKTSTGNYEIQVQNTLQYQEYYIEIDSYVSNYNTHIITYENGATVGSTGTAQYTASVGTSTFYTEGLTSKGTLTADGGFRLLDSSTNYLTIASNSGLTQARTVTLDFNKATRTITFPGTISMTLVGAAQTQTLTNKTINRADNTILGTATAVTAATTLTAAQVQGGLIVTTATPYTVTLPTGTTLDTITTTTDAWLELNFANAGGGTLTIATNTGASIVGTLTIGGASGGRFVLRRTGAATWVAYRV